MKISIEEARLIHKSLMDRLNKVEMNSAYPVELFLLIHKTINFIKQPYTGSIEVPEWIQKELAKKGTLIEDPDSDLIQKIKKDVKETKTQLDMSNFLLDRSEQESDNKDKKEEKPKKQVTLIINDSQYCDFLFPKESGVYLICVIDDDIKKYIIAYYEKGELFFRDVNTNKELHGILWWSELPNI